MTILQDERKTLDFSFNDKQIVKVYDQSKFYRQKLYKNNESLGIKATDFLCIDNSRKESFFIEIKNFRNIKKDKADQEKKKESLEERINTLTKKIFDTISGLYIASFSAQCDSSEQKFAQQFFKYKLRIVFHYELPACWSEEFRKNRMADMQQKLKHKLQIIDPYLRIEDADSSKYWVVKRNDER